MRSLLRIPAPRIRYAWVAVGLALLVVGVGYARRAPATSGPAMVCSASTAASDAAMAQQSAAHFKVSPAHGNATTVAAADTFFASDYQFDADHNLLTHSDTVIIQAGQSVMFKWVNGIHTTTNGIPGDPNAGNIWDLPVDNLNTEQVVTFLLPGTYQFHCYFHGALFGMTGTIVVNPSATPTASSSWGKVKARYR